MPSDFYQPAVSVFTRNGRSAFPGEVAVGMAATEKYANAMTSEVALAPCLRFDRNQLAGFCELLFDTLQ